MIWNITFLEEAKQDLMTLDGSVRTRVLKGLRKVSQNPLPASHLHNSIGQSRSL